MQDIYIFISTPLYKKALVHCCCRIKPIRRMLCYHWHQSWRMERQVPPKCGAEGYKYWSPEASACYVHLCTCMVLWYNGIIPFHPSLTPNYKVDQDYDRNHSQNPDSIAHTPYAIQACLLTSRTAYKYHLFTFPHYLSRGYSLQNWSPRSTQCPQALTVILMSWRKILEIGLQESNLLFFPLILDNVQWPFTAFPG